MKTRSCRIHVVPASPAASSRLENPSRIGRWIQRDEAPLAGALGVPDRHALVVAGGQCLAVRRECEIADVRRVLGEHLHHLSGTGVSQGDWTGFRGVDSANGRSVKKPGRPKPSTGRYNAGTDARRIRNRCSRTRCGLVTNRELTPAVTREPKARGHRERTPGSARDR